MVGARKQIPLFNLLASTDGYTMFKYLCSNGGWTRDDLIQAIGSHFTLKLFYTNMNKLLSVGLVKRETSNKYYVTAHGRMVKKLCDTIEIAKEYHNKFKMLDDYKDKISPEEWKQTAMTLIPDAQIRGLAFGI